MPGITVREVTLADQLEAAEMARLATLDLRKVYRPTATALKRRATIGPALVPLVAVLEGQVVGVHPDFRRRGELQDRERRFV